MMEHAKDDAVTMFTYCICTGGNLFIVFLVASGVDLGNG